MQSLEIFQFGPYLTLTQARTSSPMRVLSLALDLKGSLSSAGVADSDQHMNTFWYLIGSKEGKQFSDRDMMSGRLL